MRKQTNEQRAAQYFKVNPAADVIYFTASGQLFADAEAARAHVTRLQDKAITPAYRNERAKAATLSQQDKQQAQEKLEGQQRLKAQFPHLLSGSVPKLPAACTKQP